MQEFFVFSLAPRVLYQTGLVAEMGHEIGRLGQRRALIVTDAGVVAAGLLDAVYQGLADTVEIVGIYDQVPANSSVAVVEDCAAQAQALGANLLIAVGGGSPIDTAKCVRIMMTHGGRFARLSGL